MKSDCYALFDLAQWKNGLAFKKIDFSSDGEPVIKIAELKNGITGQTQFTEGDYGDEVHLTKGDMLFSWSGNPETSIDVFWYNLPDGWLNQHIFKVIPKPFVDRNFLYYLLKSLKATFTAIASNKQTTGLGHITLKDLKKLNIALPSEKEQKIIGRYLYTIDQKISVNQAINDNLQQQAATLFANFYEQAETEVGFTELVQILGGGTPKTGEKSYWNGKVLFFTPKDIGFPYTLSTEKTITEEGLAHCNSRLYPVNTVFVTARGTVGKIGMPGVPMAMNQSCYALIGKNTNQILVYFYTLKVVDRLKYKASGAVFDAITTRDFETESIFKLSDAHAEAFLNIARPIYRAILGNTFENQQLTALRDFLLPKLISGELDVSELGI